ncbi:AP2 domain family protein [Babesia bovis T2Bo]|uniref:AP2/ERF domain-containing protein n=1 Tax=Babesia bovis TaxID=5865 RepID=A7AW86_BABBO|nr:AP2 domain family protein [Babesia bovis T2Bo]EDO05314.1 AP2 domain family protein [Babesia bovis T2Bo]|eukprot:XP_001608882.1 hypothetical protein [Babesia bovis T2Bo]
MLVFNPATYQQTGFPQSPETKTTEPSFVHDEPTRSIWAPPVKPLPNGTNQAFFFMYQMKLLNTLGLVKSVCRPWGTLPHGNDFAYHFNQIATTNNMSLLQGYESIFSAIYDRFDAEAADPDDAIASLWAQVADVDYFKIIYRLECMRNNTPFDNKSYNEMLERTVNNVELQGDLDQTIGVSKFDEIPSWNKFNWEYKNRQYSLTPYEEEGGLHSDVDMDIAAAFNVAEQYDDESFYNPEYLDAEMNAIELEERMRQLSSMQEAVIQETHRIYNTRSQNEFDKLVMQVVSKPRDAQGLRNIKQNRTSRTSSSESRVSTRQRSSARKSNNYDPDYAGEYGIKPLSGRRKSDESRRGKKRRADSPRGPNTAPKAPSSGRSDASHEDHAASRCNNVVSASVSFDKRQQRYMAQWKTREGTKHSKSFYAKRYDSSVMARKHAELYKTYVLQHRDNDGDIMEEPTYERLAANNFRDLDYINVTDSNYMDDME